jgi:hypothetical protein
VCIFITHGVRINPAPPEIARLGRLHRGDDIPPGAPAADVVKRGELAGDVKWLVVGGRGGPDETDTVGHHGERRQQRQWLEMRDELNRAAERIHMRLTRRNAVGEEDHVELGALGALRDLDVVTHVDMGVDLRTRVPPRRHMVAGRIEIGRKAHLARHDVLVSRRHPSANNARKARVRLAG